MAIDLIGAVAASPTQTSSSVGSLGQDDFLKILMTQLTYQDPLKPMDNQQFIAQMAQFTTLEQTRLLNEKMDSFLSSQGVLQAFGLIGKNIEYSSPSGLISGKVVAINFENGQPLLTAQGAAGDLVTQIKLSSVASIRN
ncbi:flagellar hook capping protein [Chitiniphilus shinanonensis]|uniref:Basal-body rod modification protein FlgD n=1 Tax=Chitiniphilus shinanonensis TaxID=553088 RepID=A0ABQ6BX69_9NEIS|nr:flagellar hook capping FlgD N-terminal domain-containing protein [Chitiniphilus shinanonensis]GLS04389.1 flagellar hook capping protein [Chitiniphilus shinanonensis]